jgi:hypothetical protein
MSAMLVQEGYKSCLAGSDPVPGARIDAAVKIYPVSPK